MGDSLDQHGEFAHSGRWRVVLPVDNRKRQVCGFLRKTRLLMGELQLCCGAIFIRLRNVSPQTTPHNHGKQAAGIPLSDTKSVFSGGEESQSVAQRTPDQFLTDCLSKKTFKPNRVTQIVGFDVSQIGWRFLTCLLASPSSLRGRRAGVFRS